MAESIDELRERIDAVDRDLLELISRRVELAKRIGELKRALALPVADYKRELEVLERGKRFAEQLGLDVELMEIALNAIIGVCRKAQRTIRVAFLGPRGSFSEEAAVKAFLSKGAEFHPMPTIRDIFRATECGDMEYGLVPVENSLEGGVGETLDMLVETPLRICGEIKIRVSMNLIARPGLKLQDIKVVLSHPHALGQCREFLSKVLGGVEVRTCSSTADAVRRALESEGAAAIGSRIAAALYGGEVLASEIQDVRDNFTRFLILGRESIEDAVGCKTSIIFRLPHVPGSLYDALSVFASRRINLTRIESRPVKGKPWEYLFHVDFEGDYERDERCGGALEELGKKALFLKVLGCYGEIVDSSSKSPGNE
ncbi:MAG: prephenate dehydratase [Aigarchaeota archaeon]|nr:prephenate dehydratase [Aigarchaeota archaeon]